MRGTGLLRHFTQGLLMGGADVVPGVSGGTIALIVGIYERLVASVRALARGDVRGVEWGLVLPLGAGVLAAIAVGSALIPPLLERYPAAARALFFGFILGSLSIPWRRIRERAGAQWILAALGAAIAFVLVGLPARDVADPTTLRVFGSAMVAICAMILPGVSGAFLLVVLGIYEATLNALRHLDAAYVATFAAGAVFGLALFSRLLGWLLERRHDVTMALLVGLMAGSLRALWPWQDTERALEAPAGLPALLVALALAAAGFVAVRALARLQAEPAA